MIRVAVFGAAGQMGATVCTAVAGADDLELAAAVDPAGPSSMARDAAALTDAAIDVAVDFTVARAARENLEWCAASGVHAVCGTTGFSAEDLEQIRLRFEEESSPNCVLAPNFSIGAVLMMRCAELCTPHFSAVEVIELHHDRKRDAPSGTSLETVRRIEAARGGGTDSGADETAQQVSLAGARGGVTGGGTHVHSVRLPGLVAHQEVLLGSPGETLTIRHDSSDRVSFMPGVLLAIRRVAERPGLTVGLESLLGL